MPITFKKILFLLLFATFLACESDDRNTEVRPTSNNQATPEQPNNNGQVNNIPSNNNLIIDENGNINISELRRVNPNFNLENLRQLGASASDLARGNQFRSITLEVVSVEGFEPSEFAKQNLIQFIEDRLNKPGGVRIVEQTIPPLDVESFDVQSIFGSVEAVHRTEFTPEQQPHEDLAEDDNGELVGNRHCDVPFCLMEATARLSRDMMNNVNVLQLDPLCIEDLRAIGGK